MEFTQKTLYRLMIQYLIRIPIKYNLTYLWCLILRYPKCQMGISVQKWTTWVYGYIKSNCCFDIYTSFFHSFQWVHLTYMYRIKNTIRLLHPISKILWFICVSVLWIWRLRIDILNTLFIFGQYFLKQVHNHKK